MSSVVEHLRQYLGIAVPRIDTRQIACASPTVTDALAMILQHTRAMLATLIRPLQSNCFQNEFVLFFFAIAAIH